MNNSDKREKRAIKLGTTERVIRSSPPESSLKGTLPQGAVPQSGVRNAGATPSDLSALDVRPDELKAADPGVECQPPRADALSEKEQYLQWKRKHDEEEDRRNAISIRAKNDTALMWCAVILSLVAIFAVFFIIISGKAAGQ
jgi:hypothetical protein